MIVPMQVPKTIITYQIKLKTGKVKIHQHNKHFIRQHMVAQSPKQSNAMVHWFNGSSCFQMCMFLISHSLLPRTKPLPWYYRGACPHLRKHRGVSRSMHPHYRGNTAVLLTSPSPCSSRPECLTHTRCEFCVTGSCSLSHWGAECNATVNCYLTSASSSLIAAARKL